MHNMIQQPQWLMFMVNSVNDKPAPHLILPSCISRIWVYIFLQTGGTFHWRIFIRNLNSITNLFCCYSVLCCKFTTNICTCHGRSAVMACTNICRDYFAKIGMRSVENSPQIWIATEISLVSCAPEKMKYDPHFPVQYFYWHSSGAIVTW